jgi:hypothetical protein
MEMTLKISWSWGVKTFQIILKEGRFTHLGNGELTGDRSRSRFIKLTQVVVIRSERNRELSRRQGEEAT